MLREKILLLALLSIFSHTTVAGILTKKTVAGGNKTFSALFAFGDSVLDTGNNNFLLTLLKGNYWPYGRSFDMNIPTGRFGNGRVFTDFVAEGLGVKRLVPPYPKIGRLKPDELKTGICFASGGSGIDDLTSRTLRVLSAGDQVKHFIDYLKKLNIQVNDKKKVKKIISNAVFLISEGNNDIGYNAAPALVRLDSTNTYTNKMVGWTKDFLQDLYDLGARKFAVLGVMPIGCVPLHRTSFGGWCNTVLEKIAKKFNTKLDKGLQSYGVEENFKGAKFFYVDIYGHLMDLIKKPKAYGFKEEKKACCCMHNAIIPCWNPDQYVFFDFAHPSQKAYEVISKPLVYQMRKALA